MRKVINPQYLLDGVDIGAIYLDPKSRDDIPQVLRGFQYIYTNAELLTWRQIQCDWIAS